MGTDAKTRYMTIKLEIDAEQTGGSSGTYITKFITCNSGVADTQNDNKYYLDCEVIIQRSTGFLSDSATIIIRGMSEEDINTFSRVNLQGPLQLYSGNSVTIYAGYELGSDGLPPLVYQGFALRAGADYNINRDRTFIMHTMQNYYFQNTLLAPTNPQGTITIDTLCRAIATKAGLYYQSRDVQGTTKNPILVGNFDQQMTQATSTTGYYYDFVRPDTVAVAKRGTPLVLSDYTLSADTGMIGYPLLEDYGISVQCYFNPSLTIGQQITVKSLTVPIANNNKWYINAMQHVLQNKQDAFMSILQLNVWRLAVGGS